MNQKIISHPSHNFDKRPPGSRIKYLIYHYTEANLETSLKWLSQHREENPVSSHYLICERGEIYQLVEDDYRAWHAGVSSWEQDINVNATSLGIELVNPGHGPTYRRFSAPQMETLASFSNHLIAKYNISPFHILGHSDVAPLRKNDPGELFDWKYLAEQGVGVYPPELPNAGHVSVHQLQSGLRKYGYGIEVTGQMDKQTERVIGAFKTHFGCKTLSEAGACLNWLLRSKGIS